MSEINLYYFLYPFVGIISVIGIILGKEKVVYSILTFILTLITIFRFDHGYDYFWYWIVGDKKLITHSEVIRIYDELKPGIKIIYDITRNLGHPQYFFIITGLIISYCIYKTLKRESRIPIISLFLFLIINMGFYDFNFYVIQSLGMGIIFFNAHYVAENKKIKFIFIVILCSFLFHRSNIIALCYLLIPHKKISLTKYFLGTGTIFIFLKYLFQPLVNKILPKYSYLFYFKKSLVRANMNNIKMFTMLLIFIIIFFFLRKINFKDIIKKEFKLSEKEQFYQNIFIIGLILTVMLAQIFGGDLSKRIGSYFLFFGYITFGNIIDLFEIKILKILKVCFILFFLILKIHLMLKWNEVYYLNREPYINETGDLIARPNSKGLRLFFGKKYEDMSPYLPGEKKFIRIKVRENE